MPQQQQTTAVPSGAAFPLELAVESVLREAADKLLQRLQAVHHNPGTPKPVHGLRVAIRHFQAILPLAIPCLPEGAAEPLIRRLRRLRREAGHLRSLHVLRAAADTDLACRVLHVRAHRALADDLASREVRNIKRLALLVASKPRAQLERAINKLLHALETPVDGNTLFYEAALDVLGHRMATLHDALRCDQNDDENLHTTRIEIKQLRYTLRAVRVCLPDELGNRAEIALRRAQHDSGLATDLATFSDHWKQLSTVDSTQTHAIKAYLHSLERSLEYAKGSAIRAIHTAEFRACIEDLDTWLRDAKDGCGRVVGDAEAVQNAASGAATRPERFAVIDVGSNSVRLLIAESLPGGSYRTLDDEKVTTRLGQGLVATGSLTADSMDRTAEAIARMRGISRGYAVSRLRVIGTSAARDALNRREFVSLVADRAGVILEILSSEDEARLAHKSVVAGYDLTEKSAAVVDIGGGSTEIVLSTNGVIEQLCSTRLGAVRLSEMFASLSGESALKAMRRYVRDTLARALPSIPFVPSLVVGTGGTFSALLAIANARTGTPLEATHRPTNVELRRSEVRHAMDRLAGMTTKERERVPGLAPGRADIIVAGAAIAEGVLRYLGVNRLRTHDRGIRDALMLSMIEARRDAEGAGGPETTRSPMNAVRVFAESCRYERDHSEHVARLAASILSQCHTIGIGPRNWINTEARLLLEASSVLHDIGNLINYAEHHKHSFRLIMNGRIPRLSERQSVIIANIARYHRRAEPSKRHASYASLTARDRTLVRRLAAVLRIADGLDRTHTQCVRSLRLALAKPDGPRRHLTIHAKADERPMTDLWGAERKSALFANEFGLDLTFAWDEADAHHAPDAHGGSLLGGLSAVHYANGTHSSSRSTHPPSGEPTRDPVNA